MQGRGATCTRAGARVRAGAASETAREPWAAAAGRGRFAGAGAIAIAAGLALYALARPARIALVPEPFHFHAARWLPVSAALPTVLHAFALPLLTLACVALAARCRWPLPTVLHAFALPLLTLACVARPSRPLAYAACAAWLCVDVAAECAQHPAAAAVRTALQLGVLARGTFDPADVAAAALGAVGAALFATRCLEKSR